MAAIGYLLARLADVLLWAGAIAILAMMVHVTADVLLKVAFHAPIAGTLEIVSYIYMVACTFLPLAHVVLSRTLVIVELFTQKLRPLSVLRLQVAIGPLTVLYLGLIAVMGTLRAIEKTEIGEAQDATFFELPVWPMRWLLAVSCGLAALIALYQVLDDQRLVRTGRRYDGSTALALGDHPI